VDLNDALGIYWGDLTSTGDAVRSGVCAARKRLSIELMAAMANSTLLNPNSTGCGVQDVGGNFVLLSTLIEEAQAAMQPQAGLDCNNQVAWIAQMNALATLLGQFNGGGTAQALPSNLVACGVGAANNTFISANQTDPTTAANCACGAP
jgi:hypothetical protein